MRMLPSAAMVLMSTGIAFADFDECRAESYNAGCILPNELERSGESYSLSEDTRFCRCPALVYDRPVLIKTSDVYLNCNYAPLDGSQHAVNYPDNRDSGITIVSDGTSAVDSVTIRRCEIRRFRAFGINISTTTRRTHEGITRESSLDLNQYWSRDDPESPFAPSRNILIDTVWIHENIRNAGTPLAMGGGINARMQNSTIRNAELYDNYLGIYLEADSHENTIEDSVIRGNLVRSGLIIDGAFGNLIQNNHIFSNALHGIAVYKNCGENGMFWQRRYAASDNHILNNHIYGHRGSNSSVMTISRSAGIAIGMRQGLTFSPEIPTEAQLDGFRTCSDRGSHMYAWLRTPYEVGEYTITGSGALAHLMIPSADRDWVHPEYFGAHRDFADHNEISGNEIYANSLGVYVADDDTSVHHNVFHGVSNGSLVRNDDYDVFVGNHARDVINDPVRRLNVYANAYISSGWFNAYTHTETRNSMLGWNSEHVYRFAQAQGSYGIDLLNYNSHFYNP